MKNTITEGNCRKCYAPIAGENISIGVCGRCAEKELQEIPKRIRKSLIGGVIMVAVVLLIGMYVRANAFESPLPEYQDAVLIPILGGNMAISDRAFENIFYPSELGRTIFLLLCFFLPSSSFITLQYNTYRHQAETNIFKSGLVFRDVGTSVNQRMDDIGLFVISVLLSVISGPFFFVYRFVQMRKLKMYFGKKI